MSNSYPKDLRKVRGAPVLSISYLTNNLPCGLVGGVVELVGDRLVAHDVEEGQPEDTPVLHGQCRLQPIIPVRSLSS